MSAFAAVAVVLGRVRNREKGATKVLKTKYRAFVVLLGVTLLVAGLTLPSAAAKITVGVGGWAVEDLQRALVELEFTKKTGIEVEVVTRPGSPPEFLSQMTSAFMAGTTPYDVIDIEDDVAISFSQAGWLEPLDSLFDGAFWADWPADMLGMVDVWHRHEGVLFRVPHNFEAQYFFYRQDLFNAAGLTAPGTWDEMVEAGRKLTTGNRWGISDGLAKGAYLGVYLGYMTKQAGGNVYDFDDSLRTALQFIHDMMYQHRVFPVAALNKDYDALNVDYMNDRVAMMRQWPFFFDVSRANAEWFAEEKVAIALPPAGPASRETYAAAWGWSIPATSRNKEAAKTFIQFMSSVENAPKLAQMSVWYLNTRRSVLDAMGDAGLAKYLRMYSAAGVIGTRPFHPRFLEATAVVEDLASAYLTDQISLDDVIQRGRARMRSLE